jgi:hypothetical protein
MSQPQRGEWEYVPGVSDDGFREAMEGRQLIELGNGRVGVVVDVDYEGHRICVDWVGATS